MGWAFGVLHWLAFIFQLIFATICVACGLFYLTEVIEDYTIITRHVFKFTNIGVAVTYLLLYMFEESTFVDLACGLVVFGLAWLVLQQFPNIDMLSPSFIGLMVMMIVNHVTAYYYFQGRYLSFSQIVAYFTVCVWLVPLQLVLGLVAGENILPTSSQNAR